MVTLSTIAPHRIETSGGVLSVRITGNGPALLLLHGFPQTGLMWGPVAAALAERHTLIVPDLPGYGLSDAPPSVDSASKRQMAVQMIELMGKLGHERFDLAGHDRGGRVAYRLAMDHPRRVQRLAILDILPTSVYWAKMDRAFALKIYHWAFLAQPYPFPETMIAAAPAHFLETTLASWTMARSLDCFATDAMTEYRHNFADPMRLKAMCDDYRAGASVDVGHDLADCAAGRRIAAPTLVLWGGSGIAANASTPLDVWRDWAEDVRGEPIESGHFIPEENPAATSDALGRFFD